jgi:hypothetical protein
VRATTGGINTIQINEKEINQRDITIDARYTLAIALN